jgi:enoyl-CoA hydratase/carnithine racemase
VSAERIRACENAPVGNATTDDRLVERHRHGDVLELRLANPPRNALTGPLLVAYVEQLAEATRDDRVRAVVTTSDLDSWCVGGDLDDLTAGDGRDLSDLLHDSTGESADLSLADRAADQLGVGRHVLAIDGFAKPLIAAIGGAAAGGGLALALLHDVRFASEQALFTVAFSRIGLSLEMGLSTLLPRAVGPQAAFDLAVTSRRLGAEEAAELGLVWQVVDHEQLVAAALTYAREVAGRPPLGVQLAKRLLRRSWDHRLADQLEVEWPSQVAAFRHPDSQAAIDRLRSGERP